MAVRKLTQLLIDRITPQGEKHFYVWDATLPGFGLRVAPTGRKSWVANCRVQGRLVPTTLGSTDLVPSIAQARQLARQAMLEARAGVDPVQARRAKAAVAKAEAEAVQAQQQADAYTLNVLAEDFCGYSAARHKASTAKENRRLLARAMQASGLGPQPAAAITTAELRKFANGIRPGQKGELERSNQLLAISRAYAWGIDTGKCESNPCIGIKVPKRAGERDRILSDQEIVKFWKATEEAGLAWAFVYAFRLLLITGQRLNEVCAMEWTELDIENKQWLIAAARTKNGRANMVPLSDMALAILTHCPRIGKCKFLFTTDGRSHIQATGWAKSLVAKQMGSDVPPFVLHDLRRTFSSGLQALGVRFETNEGLLNHSGMSRSGVAKIYQRYQWTEEKKTAMNDWSKFLAGLVGEA